MPFSYFFIFFLCSYLLYGCVSLGGNDILVEQLPKWVVNPSTNGMIGGVGYCSAHINGLQGQRELATKRALEEIARQKGVAVDSIMVVSSKASNQTKNNNTNIDTISTFQSKSNVIAYIKEVWVHPVTKEMYVYMVAE